MKFDHANINMSTHTTYDGLYLTIKCSKIAGNNILNVARKLGISDRSFHGIGISNRTKVPLNERN